MDNSDFQKWMQWSDEFAETFHTSLLSISPDNLKSKFDHLKTSYSQEHKVRIPDPRNNVAAREFRDVLGIYKMVGHNPDNRKALYRGNLTLYWESPSVRAIWEIGPQQYQFGRGFFSNGFLYLAFYYTDDEKEFDGQIIYQFTSDKRLVGFWVEEGSFVPGYEELLKIV
ncbi:MAG: hypothetical protein MI784_10145 [Cytophagales bacterium]|nr:hypothetical protein [Cytophagales bacterium]